MRLFDLHCGTIEELKERGEDYFNYTTQLSLRNRDEFQKAVQVMAVFVPDDIHGQEMMQFVLDYHQYMDDQVGKIGGQVEPMGKIMDLDRILDKGRWAFIRSTESGVALNGDLDSMSRFADLGFKTPGLVWNGASELGSGPNNDTGFIIFRREAIKRMKQVGMTVDCSHLSDAGFEDLLNIVEHPFAAPHFNIRACYGHPRNLMDVQFKELVCRGELCGLNLFSRSIGDDNSGNKDYLLRHICRMLELGGEDVIAWGGDMDGEITCDPGLSTPYRMGRFANYLAGHSIGEAAVQKIFFDNVYRFSREQVR